MGAVSVEQKRRLQRQLVLLVPALLFGLLVSLQWRTQSERSELTVRYNAPLTDAASALQNEQNGLKAQLTDLRAHAKRADWDIIEYIEKASAKG